MGKDISADHSNKKLHLKREIKKAPFFVALHQLCLKRTDKESKKLVLQ